MKTRTVATLLALALMTACSGQKESSTAPTSTSTTVAATSTTTPDPAQAACKDFYDSLGSGDTDQHYAAIQQLLISRDSRIVAAAKAVEVGTASDDITALPKAMEELVRACQAAGFLPS
jgi:ABC-type transport system substrate-binding protein